jgi:hypothetical protein
VKGFAVSPVYLLTNKNLFMTNKNLTQNTDEVKNENPYIPFVNEECGDTMWDEILEDTGNSSPGLHSIPLKTN